MESAEWKLQQIEIIFNAMSYMAWMKDRDGKYLVVNRSFIKRHGKQHDVLLGKTDFDLFESDVAAKCEAIENEVMLSKKPQYMDLLVTDKIGGKSWFDVYVAPLYDEQGAVIGTIGTSRKITKRKQLEIQIENQKKFLKTMIDTIPDLIFYKDTNSVFLGGNKNFVEKYIGLSEDQIVGKTDWDVISDKKSASNYRREDQEVFAAGVSRANEQQRTFIDGSIGYFETVKAPFYDEQGKIAGLIGISRDISARKRIEEQLRRRERQAQQELNLAARIQQEALPLNFSGARVQVKTIFKPYETVSGDLVNYKWFEKQQKFRGYVVDVSGHGVSTALQTATVKMVLDSSLLGGQEINEDVFQHLNQRMLQYLSEESFAALLYFEFNFNTKMLTIISGGINLFLVAKNHECSLISVNSCYLGVLDHADIQTMTMPFTAGEIYGMMSDGVSDLIELHGLSKQTRFVEYIDWLTQLSVSPECRDDFSVVCIEILPENKKVKFIHIQNDDELEYAQILVSQFIELHARDGVELLEVAVNEAINNAVRAGRRVFIKARRVGQRLLFRIKDDGPGFNTRQINGWLRKAMKDEEFDAAFDDLVLKEGGRGILMMKMLCDGLLYNRKGNEVLLMKKIIAIIKQ